MINRRCLLATLSFSTGLAAVGALAGDGTPATEALPADGEVIELFDGATLDQIWPQSRPYGPRPWIGSETGRSDTTELNSESR